MHRYDFKTRKSDVALSGVSSFQMSFGGEKALYREGDNWIIASLRPAPSGSGGGGAEPARQRWEQGRVEDQRNRSAGRPGRGVEADVPRSLADRARLVLRPQHPRPGPQGGGEEVRAVPRRHRVAERFDVPVPGDAGQHGGEPHGHGRRRHAGGQARRDRAAGLRLRGRRGPVSLCARI